MCIYCIASELTGDVNVDMALSDRVTRLQSTISPAVVAGWRVCHVCPDGLWFTDNIAGWKSLFRSNIKTWAFGTNQSRIERQIFRP